LLVEHMRGWEGIPASTPEQLPERVRRARALGATR
jgi:hypothetical protein